MTTDSTQATVRERVKRALIMNALTDWRGGIVLAISILLAFFGPDLFPAIPPWVWLLGGGAASPVPVYDGSIYFSELVPQYASRGLDRFKEELDLGMSLGHRAFKIKIGRGLCYKRRGSIGKVDGPQPIPRGIDDDLWCGPALKLPLMRSRWARV